MTGTPPRTPHNLNEILVLLYPESANLYSYNLHRIVLEHVTLAKYVSVTFQNDMKCNTQINNITSSANGSLGFLRRNLQVNSHDLKTVAYNALVRHILEYVPSVWDLHTRLVADMDLII